MQRHPGLAGSRPGLKGWVTDFGPVYQTAKWRRLAPAAQIGCLLGQWTCWVPLGTWAGRRGEKVEEVWGVLVGGKGREGLHNLVSQSLLLMVMCRQGKAQKMWLLGGCHYHRGPLRMDPLVLPLRALHGHPRLLLPQEAGKALSHPQASDAPHLSNG